MTMAKEIDPEVVRKALEAGDGDAIAKLSIEGKKNRVESINPQIQKSLAAAIMSVAKYSVNPKISESISQGGAQLVQLKDLLKGKNQLTADVEKILDAQIEAQKKSFAKSDGIQKSWQAFVIDLACEHFEKIKLPKAAKALREAQAEIVKNGQKRAMTPAEKKAWEAAKAGEDEEEDAGETAAPPADK